MPAIREFNRSGTRRHDIPPSELRKRLPGRASSDWRQAGNGFTGHADAKFDYHNCLVSRPRRAAAHRPALAATFPSELIRQMTSTILIAGLEPTVRHYRNNRRRAPVGLCAPSKIRLFVLPIVTRLFHFLEPRMRRQFGLLLVPMLMIALLELAAIPVLGLTAINHAREFLGR